MTSIHLYSSVIFVYVTFGMVKYVWPADIWRVTGAFTLGVLLGSLLVIGFVKTIFFLKPKAALGFLILLSWMILSVFITEKAATWVFQIK